MAILKARIAQGNNNNPVFTDVCNGHHLNARILQCLFRGNPECSSVCTKHSNNMLGQIPRSLLITPFYLERIHHLKFLFVQHLVFVIVSHIKCVQHDHHLPSPLDPPDVAGVTKFGG